VRNQDKTCPLKFYEQYFGCWNAGWLAFYDFFRKIGIVQHDDFVKYSSLQRQGFSIVMFRHFVVVCKLPKTTRLDSHGLHATNGPSIEWRDGINTSFYIHGISFGDSNCLLDDGRSLYYPIIERTMDVKDVLKIENIEQRRVSMNHYGMNNIFEHLNHRLLDKSKRSSRAELYLVKDIVPEIDILMVKYQDPSTGRKYVSQVADTNEHDNNAPIKTADQAMAWKSQMSIAEYNQLMVEA
jgi:hypothetical protein